MYVRRPLIFAIRMSAPFSAFRPILVHQQAVADRLRVLQRPRFRKLHPQVLPLRLEAVDQVPVQALVRAVAAH